MSSDNTNSLALSLAKSILKKANRERLVRGNVTFDMVTVFVFPRCQGFSSVPSRGGCSLGMMQRHSAFRRYTLDEYAVAQHILRREKLLDRLREEKLDALKQKVSPERHTHTHTHTPICGLDSYEANMQQCLLVKGFIPGSGKVLYL